MDEKIETLSEAAEQYLRSQAQIKYPQVLASKFPRVVNRIVQLKDDRNKLNDYFHSLITDLRGNRKGFPFEVLMEIEDLRASMLGETTPLLHEDDRTKWVS
ncbi:MAG: hypothetical protein ACO3AC_10755 [Hylemonella sp.]|jgi:hypothetical protein